MVIQKLVSPKADARIANGSRASTQVGMRRLAPFASRCDRTLPPEPPKTTSFQISGYDSSVYVAFREFIGGDGLRKHNWVEPGHAGTSRIGAGSEDEVV